MVMKLLKAIGMGPNTIQLTCRAVSANVRPFEFHVQSHYFDGGEIINGSHHWCFTAHYFSTLISYRLLYTEALYCSRIRCVGVNVPCVTVKLMVWRCCRYKQLCMRIDPKCVHC